MEAKGTLSQKWKETKKQAVVKSVAAPMIRGPVVVAAGTAPVTHVTDLANYSTQLSKLSKLSSLHQAQELQTSGLSCTSQCRMSTVLY